MTAKRRLKNARITHLSLCRKGRNKLKTIMKSGSRIEVPLVVSKMDETEGLLYSLVWAPGHVDIDGDIMDATEIQKMAHGFLSNGGNIDVEHDLDPLSKEQVQIAETLIVQKGDERFSGMTYDGETIDPTGSWGIVLKILDPELKAAYDAGDWDGISMFGQAEGSPVHKTQPQPEPETSVMDEDTIKALVAKAVADGITASKKADADAKLVADLAKAEADKAAGITFEGDPTNVEDVAKHQAKLTIAKVDWNDPKSVAAYQATLKVETKEVAKSDNDVKIEKLQKEIDSLEAASTVGVTKADESNTDEAEVCGLSKSEMEGAQLGLDLISAFEGRKPAK
jgi:hypothetical protein